MSTRHAGTTRQRGLTLIELLISLVLLALILSILFGALNLGSRSWDAVEAHSSAVQDRRVVWTFLQGIFERAYATDVQAEGGKPRLAFGGRDDMLELVSLMPQGVGLAGHYLIRLEMQEASGAGQLVLRYWLLSPEVLAGSGDVPQWTPINDGGSVGGALEENSKPSILYGERILLSQLKQVEFFYGQVEADKRIQWRERWDDDRETPDLLKMTWHFENGDWPDLVVPLMAKTNAGSRTGVIGSGRKFTPWAR
jgi:prepilin-type N-terminal cleavage/methylation domain-containing protein